MLARELDCRERGFKPVPISYLVQTANQFHCDIFVSSDRKTANVKNYDEMKNLKLRDFVTFYFRGSDELEAKNRILMILWD